jgi:hypothetical protein
MGTVGRLLIMIDEIDFFKKTDSETSVLFEFIAYRYESGVVQGD